MTAQDYFKTSPGQIQQLMKVALGEAEADLAIVNGTVVNVYTGELISGDSVLIKGDRIAYIGKNAGKSIGTSTRVVDASGKILIPGLIDGHTHIDWLYPIDELLRYSMKGGTTTIITETSNIAFPLGVQGVSQFLRAIQDQPVKVFVMAPPMVTLSPASKEHAITVSELRRLFRNRGVLGLGEAYWGPVLDGDPRILELIAETLNSKKTADGHGAGARDNRLQAYVTSGVSSCHEPITTEEVKERLRLGLFVILREGEVRRELETVATIKDEKVDLRRLAASTDGIDPGHIIKHGHMEFILQKLIDLGFDPVTAIQMTTINVAQRTGLDSIVGGIAPGKYADVVIIPDLKTIRAEYVVSNGQIVAKNGQLLTQPRKHKYPASWRNSIRLPRDFTADDFTIGVDSRQAAKVRVIDQITRLVTKEAIIDMPALNGQLRLDTDKDIIKVAAIERTHQPGKTSVGFIRGIGLRHGAIAISITWDCSNIIVVGADEKDMALAVNRLKELGGGNIVCDNGKVIAELALPLAGLTTTESMEAIAENMGRVQQAAASLGSRVPDLRTTLAVLATPAIPFLRICEAGLFDLKQNRFVDLIVP